jgi:hypothetical protein
VSDSDKDNGWQKAYQAALLEVDPAKLPELIDRAYKAIHACMNSAVPSPNENERQALADAMANLRVLRREADLPFSRSLPKKPDSAAADQ